MKLNFKRIASVLTGAVMLSSTVALAAAANFPAPFTSGDSAVVYGATAATTDMVKATAISDKLSELRLIDATSAAPAAPVVTVSGEGDSMVLEGSTKLHLGSALSTSFTKTVTDDSDMLPTLLASGTYTDVDGTDFDYDQEIEVNTAMQPLQFSDTDVNDGDPTIGVQIPSGSYVLNYTLDFADEPEFDDSIETTSISLMGKDYYILSADNSTDTITLLDSATTVTVAEGSTKEVTVNGKTYSIAVTSVLETGDGKVKFSVNGKSSSSALAAGGTIKIAEGVYAAVKEVTYRGKESAVSDADISIGTGKLTLQDGNEVEANDDVINGLYAYVDGADTLDSITLKWTTENDEVIVANSSITMPGFGAVKLSTTGMDYPAMEETQVTTDGKAFVLETTVKDGDVKVPFLAINDSNAVAIIGKEETKQLRTSNTNTITYDDDTDDMFVVSWASGDESESYVLRANGFSEDSSDRNVATIQKNVDGTWKDVKEVKNGDTVSLGNVDLLIGAVNKVQKNVVITNTSANTQFDVLYTKEGLKVQLPYAVSTAALAGPAGSLLNNATTAATTFALAFFEENEDDTIAAGENFNLTLQGNSDNDATVNTVAGDSDAYEVGDSNLYVSQVYGDLATTVEHDRDPVQNTAKVIYHGSESTYGLILSAPSVTIGGGDGGDVGKVLVVKDTEAASLTGSNLIVVGGSCINTVAAKLLGSTTPLCGADFTAKTQVSSGEYLIKTYESPFNSAKIATLVAGYNAADTENGVNYLLAQNVSTAKGDAYKNGVKLTVGSA